MQDYSQDQDGLYTPSQFGDQKALLVVVLRQGDTELRGRHDMEELKNLTSTMGITNTMEITVKLREPHPKFLLGTGKVDEIHQLVNDNGIDLIIVDTDLSPSQQRNWETLTEIAVIDRQEVILDIFAQRAHTREAVLQVALARLTYSLPRLTRRWTNLSQQRGGVKGSKGAGETQLELDRRLVLHRVDMVKEELLKVRQHRDLTRKKRTDNGNPSASLVGYTNAGKSTLLNLLTGAGVLVEDKLFATLDPTTRRFILEKGQELLVTDTVGFVRKLPHGLIDAFRSTLEEAIHSDFLIHVIDVADPDREQQMETTLQVLEELGAKDKPLITLFNKCDKIQNDPVLRNLLEVTYPEAVFLSALSGDGLGDLQKALAREMEKTRKVLTYQIPFSRGDITSYLHQHAQVLEEKYLDAVVEIRALVEPTVAGRLQDYLFTGEST